MPLNLRQERFVAEYLIDLNATQAAIRAGYSEKTAQHIGYQLLQKTLVVEAITVAQAARNRRTGIDADWVLKRLAAEADADLADLYDEKGVLKPITDWPIVWRTGLVAGIETATEYEEVEGQKQAAGMVHKLKLSDRIRRLELIGKHITVGAFADRHEHTGKDGGPIESKAEVKHAGSEAALQRAGELLARALAIGSPGANAQADPNGPVLPIEVRAGTLGHGASVAAGENPGSPE